MGVFYHEEPPNHPKRCKYLVATLKEVFSRCQTFAARLSTSSFEDECPVSDFDEKQELFISAVISRNMEKQKHKPSVLRHSFSWVYSPATKELYFTQAVAPEEKVVKGDEESGEGEEFLSVKSCFSRCSSSPSGEAFYSVKTNLSRCSSLNELDLSKYWRRSVIQEFCHCQGWPFGLCRRAVLLPPLPMSPSESWLSRKMQPTIKKP
ncbi:hypothetical protein AAZX31_04G037100 [Glycine max]|uniref:Uncharacterized protein n=2 Tax=Glycine subgen. Soja TaxID=1462606 RepID=I1JTI0_SOYBN|nr:uncharacterized protein LOC114408690 [Glycine soja]KAG5048133.1 hypothetical protein JHK85_009236 [Glycine max]KAG5033936.1 hypothetical protein JHK87_008846 [Glycine soja]KAH1109635.1 hypothetical protein GYH30_008845 [Glycine max]KHN04514.1 hypothetical protein glysoja_019601 [Glycine soja]KRH61263.1 hypothetical protein GLYMA_04G037500v4 [Glycine max]